MLKEFYYNEEEAEDCYINLVLEYMPSNLSLMMKNYLDHKIVIFFFKLSLIFKFSSFHQE